MGSESARPAGRCAAGRPGIRRQQEPATGREIPRPGVRAREPFELATPGTAAGTGSHLWSPVHCGCLLELSPLLWGFPFQYRAGSAIHTAGSVRNAHVYLGSAWQSGPAAQPHLVLPAAPGSPAPPGPTLEGSLRTVRSAAAAGV